MQKTSNKVVGNVTGINPIRDLILVKPEENVKSEEGVIIIPESAKRNELAAQTFGYVVALGSICYKFEKRNYDVDVEVKPGDRIMFAKYSGIVVIGEDKQEYRLIRDDDVQAVIGKKVQREILS